MTESDKPTSGDDDWGGPEETPWQQEPPASPQQPQQPEQPPQYGGTQPPPYGQQPPQYGQPPPQYGGPQYGGPPTHQPGQRLPNYLVHNIIATVLCCLPAGIVGIVFASQVNGKLGVGDYAGAKKASDSARLWFIISIVAAAVGWIVYLIIAAIAASQGTV